MICGKKAIHEALITNSKEFADRPELYTQSLFNPEAKGCDVSCYQFVSPYYGCKDRILPRDAMLVWYMLSSSVCMSHAGIVLKRQKLLS